jgi:phage terminase large subunit-like protein
MTASKILMAIRDYRPVAVGIERGALKNAVLPYLNDLMRKNNVYSHIHDLTHGNRKKADRVVWALQGRMEHGRVSFNVDEDWREFEDQLLMFPSTGVHDDLVDSLAYCDQLAITTYQQDYQENEHEILDIVSGY